MGFGACAALPPNLRHPRHEIRSPQLLQTTFVFVGILYSQRKGLSHGCARVVLPLAFAGILATGVTDRAMLVAAVVRTACLAKAPRGTAVLVWPPTTVASLTPGACVEELVFCLRHAAKASAAKEPVVVQNADPSFAITAGKAPPLLGKHLCKEPLASNVDVGGALETAMAAAFPCCSMRTFRLVILARLTPTTLLGNEAVIHAGAAHSVDGSTGPTPRSQRGDLGPRTLGSSPETGIQSVRTLQSRRAHNGWSSLKSGNRLGLSVRNRLL